MTKKRYLRPCVQIFLEMNAMVSLGLLCSISILEVNIWTILLMTMLCMILAVSGIALKKYGRYDDEI